MSIDNTRGHLISCPELLTLDQLKARIRIHESTAAMYEQKGEPQMARKFRDVAAPYAQELDLRQKLLLATSNIGGIQ